MQAGWLHAGPRGEASGWRLRRDERKSGGGVGVEQSGAFVYFSSAGSERARRRVRGRNEVLLEKELQEAQLYAGTLAGTG